MIEHTLKSGRSLEITPAPFADAKEIYQVLAEELKTVDMDEEKEIDVNFLKGVFLSCIGSKKLEAAIWKVLPRCKYNGHKITPDTFEEVESREDYFEICWLASKENVSPFTKTLMQEYSHLLGVVKKILA